MTRHRRVTGRATSPRARMAGRVALFLGGTTVSTLCYALTIRAGLGLGPLFVLQDGFARTTGISIGAAVTATGFMCVAVAMCLRFWPGPGTLAQPVLGGVTLNAVLPHVPTLHGWPLRIAVVFVATWVMALGGVMMIRARVGVAAYDSVMLGLHRVLRRRRLALIRLGMEATVLVVGFVLGGAVGVGTLITGGLIGPGIHFWLRLTGGPLPVPAPPAVAVAVADWEPSPTGATG